MNALIALALGSAMSLAAAPADVVTTGYWAVMDVAAGTGFIRANAAGDVADTGLRLEVAAASTADLVRETCTVIDTTRGERPVTLAYILPFDGTGWRWWDDARRSREVTGTELFRFITWGYYGTDLLASRYPVAAMDNGAAALCLGVPPDDPRAVRFQYDPVARQLRAEFDFGLSPLPEQFPSRADATVLAWTAPGEWPFRRALDRFYGLFGEALKRHAGPGGTLLRGSPLSTIEGPEDFGFAWHDFSEDYVSVLDWAEVDEKHGVASFLYREPQTHWRALRGPLSGTTRTDFQDGTLGGLTAEGTVTLLDGKARIASGAALVIPGFPTVADEDLEAEFTLTNLDQMLGRSEYDVGWQGRFWCGIRKGPATEGVARVGAFDFWSLGRQDGEKLAGRATTRVTVKLVSNRKENMTRVFAGYDGDARQGDTAPRLHLVGTFPLGGWTGSEGYPLRLRNYAPVPVLVDDVIVTRFSGEDPPATYETYRAQLGEDADRGDAEARATLVSGAFDRDGRWNLYLENIVWAQTAPFGVNAAPGARGGDWPDWPDKMTYEQTVLGRILGWDGTPSLMEGSYFDSLQGWGNVLNYRRDHWKTTAWPLTFDRKNGNAVCLLNIWGNVAHAQALAAELHAHGQLLAGNDAWYHLWFHMAAVDIPGREINNYRDGEWSPPSDEDYLIYRSLAGRKPFWTLMNDNFDDGSHMEEYFQRSLFYGILPSMYWAHDGMSAWYWATPDYYNRDRHLFVKYVPLLRRVDAAGWEPVPFATVDADGVLLERFGTAGDGDLAFTLHNTADAPVTARLTLDTAALGMKAVAGAEDWVGEAALAVEGTDTVVVELAPGGYAAVGIDAHLTGERHTADRDADGRIGLSELLRVVQLHNSGALQCAADTEDGYAPGAGDTACAPHDSDYAPLDWSVNLAELLRLGQFYNVGAYHARPGTEDGFSPGL